jgi:hypoxanthine phosphoribosyltransferase
METQFKESNSYPWELYSDKTVVVNDSSFINKEAFVMPKNYEKYLDKIVLSKGLIMDRIEKLAQLITKDYFNKHLVLLVVMKGAVVFGSTLAEKITDILSNDVTNSYSMTFSVEYIDIKSYQDDKSTGDVKIKVEGKIEKELQNKHVLIVEDIYDSGQCLDKLIKYLSTLNVLSIKSTVLIQKMNVNHLKYNYQIEYLGFLIPNSFVVGFGMDYNEEFRQLRHLCVLNKEGISHFKSK